VRRSNGAASRMHSRARDDIRKDVHVRIVIVFLRSEDTRIGIAPVLQRLRATGRERHRALLPSACRSRRLEYTVVDGRSVRAASFDAANCAPLVTAAATLRHARFFSTHEVGAMYWVISV
jgi:hypothetical protein